MSREDPQMKIRLPSELKDRIEEASRSAGRSLNAEIVARLQASFDGAGSSSTADVLSAIAQLQGRLDQASSASDRTARLCALVLAVLDSVRATDHRAADELSAQARKILGGS